MFPLDIRLLCTELQCQALGGFEAHWLVPVSLSPMPWMFAPEKVVFTFSVIVSSRTVIHRSTTSLDRRVSASRVDGSYREFRWCWMSRVGRRLFISL